jgi:hypothetical protein
MVLGHLEPDLAGGQHAGHLRGADPEHVGAEGAAGRRMAVAPDNQHARLQMPAFRQHHVADAFAIVEGDLPLPGPLAGQFENARAFVGVAGHEVIGNQHHLGGIEQADAEFLAGSARPVAGHLNRGSWPDRHAP